MSNSIISELDASKPLDRLLITREGIQVHLWCVAHLKKNKESGWFETKVMCSKHIRKTVQNNEYKVLRISSHNKNKFLDEDLTYIYKTVFFYSVSQKEKKYWSTLN